jgi:hypothetical protein
MKPLHEVEALLLDAGLKASGLDHAALESIRGMLAPEKSRGRGHNPEVFPLPNKMALAGFTIAEHARAVNGEMPGSEVDVLAHSTANVRQLFDSVPPLDSEVWCYFELGQWGATGDRTYLSRIMDRARHRDGSSASIASSSHALGLLQLAAFSNPAYLGIYSEMGFDPEAVKYSNNPAPRTSFDSLRGDLDLSIQAVDLDPDAGKPETKPAAIPAVMTARADSPIPSALAGVSSDVVQSDSDSGTISTPFGSISITDALATISALTVATRRLLLPLPYEGYQWDDYAGSDTTPASVLFTNDTFEGERLKLFQPVPLNPTFIAARVAHDGVGWIPALFDPAAIAFMPVRVPDVRFDDLNDAKFAAASALRKKLAASGAVATGSPAPPTPEEAAATQVGAQTIRQNAIEGDAAPVLEAPAAAAAQPAAVAPKKKTAAKKATKKAAAKRKAKG